MRYKHIIFDLDGTLLDTESAVVHSLIETLKEIQDKDYLPEELNFILGIPGETALQKLGINNLSDAKSVWKKKFKAHFSKVKLFPNVIEIIDIIKEKGITVGVLTSKTREEYEHDFLPFGLGEKIDFSFCVDEYEIPKPSPESMIKYLNRVGLKPQEALYIGDTSYDFECANDAGVDFGLAVWNGANHNGIQGAYFFTTPQDIRYVLADKHEEEDLLVKTAIELQFIGQVGETYTKDPFDLERFERIREIAAELLSLKTSFPIEKVKSLFCNETGFQTPKLDVRAAIVQENKILLVQERNYTWSLPGGWVDVNETIKTSVIKEVYEEAGLNVRPIKLIAIQDRNLHNEPPYAFGIAKAFVLCELIDGFFKENKETIKSDYFSIDDLPELAKEKINSQQIKMCLSASKSKEWQTMFD